MEVNPSLPVSATISASDNPVCAGTSVTCTSSIINGGSTPAYQWYKNGIPVTGATNSSYTLVPLNGDMISLSLTSNALCSTNSPATSNVVPITVNPTLPVSITISASASPVCAGTTVTFTSSIVNGGSNPVYQWYKNSVVIPGATNSSYACVPLDNDQFDCILTSDAVCATGSPATSNVTTINVDPYGAVSVTITPSANPSCAGNSVVFSSLVLNGGSAPTYQWKLNGGNVSGATNPTYTFIPANNDNVQCIVTSNYPCATGSPANSNTEVMTVNSIVPVSVSIVASVYAVMPSTSVTYTATPVNGGTSPGYQWKKNGTAISGAVSSTYSYMPSDHDKITCVLTNISGGVCMSNNPATSNEIIMVVYTTGTACAGIPTVDYGGLVYNTVQIGAQCWLRENINIGGMVSGTQTQANNSIVEKYCYGNLESNCNVYGGLYQWAEMVQYLNNATNTTNWSPVPTGPVQGICPVGWHIPTNTEMTTLATTLGGASVAGGKIKEATTAHFNYPNTLATNSSGFTALPGGLRWSTGVFYYIKNDADIWTVTSGVAATDIYYGGASYGSQVMNNSQFYKVTGLSVRCLKN
jgi:uncharacterized protein (TIGR02145 family)